MHVNILASPPDPDLGAGCPPPSIAQGASPHEPALRQQWAREDDCRRCAERLAAVLAPRLLHGTAVVLELRGTLGAGKTTFTRHLLRALGVQGRIKSPSYAVVEPHEAAGGIPVWHFDFYRFTDPREWEDAGFRDIFGSAGLKVVEWPDKACGLLPPADLLLDLDTDEQERRLAGWRAHTPEGQQMLARLRGGTP